MGLRNQTRALIYNKAITGLTAGWYESVLRRVPHGCRLLDIGIGTGSALLANADTLIARDIRVTGVDIDAAYIERCRREVDRRNLGARISPRLESIYDHHGGPYDAAYFSASFMLLPDPPAALHHVRTLLAPEGRIYFTQTFEHRPSPLVERFKPLLRHLTTIDFGQVTYEADFRRALAAGGLTLETFEPLNTGKRRSGFLAVGRAG